MPNAVGVDCYHFQRLSSDPSASAGMSRWVVGATYQVGAGRNRYSEFFHRRILGRRRPGGEFRRAVEGANDVLRTLDQHESRKRGMLRYGYEDLLHVLRGTTTALQARCNLVRELIFEDVRVQEFPARPSRQRCVWLAPSWTAVQFWEKWGPRPKQWFKVRLLNGRIHLADSALVTSEYLTVPELRDQARAYWAGNIAADHVRAEYLFEGDLQVLATLDPAMMSGEPPG